MHGPARAFLLAGAAGVYLLLHVATLTRGPVPYFDDTFFASVGESFTRTGALTLPVSPLWMHGPVYLYGPVYFLMQRLVFAQLGFDIFQNRVLGLVFGLALVLVTFAALRRAGIRKNVACATCVLLALDPTLNLSLHSGRMDGVALFFVLGAFVVLQTAWTAAGPTSLLLCGGSGLLAGVGMLTTPRPGFLVVCVGVVLVLRWLLVRTRMRALQLVCWALPLLGLYLVWVAYAFGSVALLAAYYGQFASKYVGGRFIVRPVHFPLLAVLAGVGALRLAAQPKVVFDELFVFALAGIVAFYALGIDPPGFGTVYSIFTIPLAYMVIARLTQTLESERVLGVPGRTIGGVAFAALLATNAGAFMARTVLELSQWSSRDPAPVARMMQAAIPPGSKVIGDDKFYYAVVNAGSDYQYWERGGTLAARVAYHTDHYDYDYLVTNADERSELFAAYAARSRLIKVTSLAPGDPNAVAEWLTGIARRMHVGTPLIGDYASTVFKRAGAAEPH